jgi:uncharacterized Fe-S cluster-containing MiaB family protein
VMLMKHKFNINLTTRYMLSMVEKIHAYTPFDAHWEFSLYKALRETLDIHEEMQILSVHI